jgi:CYTH domain-containing protein
MKIETEAKFVLKPDSYRGILDALDANKVPHTISVMEYFFVDNLRFRSTRLMSMKNDASEWEAHLNFKLRIDDRSAEEFEYPIPMADYEAVVKHKTTEELGRKFRIAFDDANGHWDIDLYNHGPQESYVMLAECEFEIQDPIVPEFLKPFILWQVPYEHKNVWSSKKLMDSNYRSMMMELLLARLTHFPPGV